MSEPPVQPVPKEKKPRTEAQMKAFASARAKLEEKNAAKRFSRQQEEAKVEEARATMESKVKAEIPDAEVKIMERRKPKPKPEPKPKMLEVVIPAHVEKAMDPPPAPRKPRAPRAPRAKPESEEQHDYPETHDAPPLSETKPRNVLVQPNMNVPSKTMPPQPVIPTNPYMAMIQARMRR
jgi:hypothetical protein